MARAGVGAEHVTITADGVIDFGTGDSHARRCDVRRRSVRSRASIEMRIVDGVAYMKLPATLSAGSLGSGKRG